MASAISDNISSQAYCCGNRRGYLGLFSKEMPYKIVWIPENYDFWVDLTTSTLD